MADTEEQVVWTVVEVWRGFASGAQVFGRLSDAQRTFSRLRRSCNLLENDVQIFESRVVKPSIMRQRRVSPP